MKQVNRNMLRKIISVLLVVINLCSTSITVFAESDTSTSLTNMNDTTVELQNMSLSDGGSYRYTAPTQGDFLIQNIEGTIFISNSTPVLHFLTNIVPLPVFDYYKLVDSCGNTRYYQADTLKDPTSAGGFAYIAIHIEASASYKIHIQYYIESENKMYNIITALTYDQFQYFDLLSVPLCLGSDVISKRLKSAGRQYRFGTFLDQGNAGPDSISNTATPTSLNPITANTYDDYTDWDGTIRAYEDTLFGECYLEDDWTITDDPIVDIIPKELCFILGEHIYILAESMVFLFML